MDDDSPVSRQLSRRQALVGILTAGAIAVPVVLLVRRRSGGDLDISALPDMGPAPAFSLLDQAGRPLNSTDLLGHVVVVNFIFTSCTSACPLLTERMAMVARVLSPTKAPRLRFLSVSIDPERDTPAVLKAFATTHGATDPRWSFVTGEPSVVAGVISGYKMAAQRQDAAEDGHYDIVHSERFVLIDAAGHLRGFYRTDQDGVRSVTNHAWLMVKATAP